ncbi:hypothetical protein BJ684DRAFT_16993, partial [Piptocephalis cylindrospora]
FATTLANGLPERLFPQAVLFHRKHYARQEGGRGDLDGSIEPGGMLALLSEVSQGQARLYGEHFTPLGQATLTPGNTAKYFNPQSLSARIGYQRLSAASVGGNKGSDGIFHRLEDKYEELSALISKVHRRRLLEKGKRTKEEEALERASSRSLSPLEQWTYHLLVQAGEAGMTIKEIEGERLKEGNEGPVKEKEDKDWETNFCRALNVLTQHGFRDTVEPLAMSLGFAKEIRYVVLDYLPDWAVGYCMPGEKDMEVPSTLNLHIPRSWIGLYGRIIQPILTAYLEAILALIIQYPGIYEDTLYDRLGIIACPSEIRELLQVMVEVGALTRRQVQKPEPISLFSLAPPPLKVEDAYQRTGSFVFCAFDDDGNAFLFPRHFPGKIDMGASERITAHKTGLMTDWS